MTMNYIDFNQLKTEKLERELYWKNWKENKNSDSLHNYAFMLQIGIGSENKEKDKKMARELYRKNWKENKNYVSLYNYVWMLEDGIGGEKNENLARELLSKYNN